MGIQVSDDFSVFVLLCVWMPSVAFAQLSPSTIMESSSQLRDVFLQEMEPGQRSQPTAQLIPETMIERDIPKVKIDVTMGDEGAWKLTFTFPQQVTFKKSEQPDNNALLLEFNQAIESPDFEHAQEQLAYIIKRFSTGYNKLYLIGKRAITYKTETADNVFVLGITPNYDIPAPDTLALRKARARLLAEERRYMAALRELYLLKEEYPDDKDVPILLASLEALLPRWQQGLQILEALNERYPRDDDVLKLMYEAYSPHAPFLLYQRQVQRTVTVAAVQVNRLQCEQILASDSDHVLYGGTLLQNYRGHVSGIVNSQGNIVGFLQSRAQGNLYLRNEWINGSHTTGLVYAQRGCLGFGAEATHLVPATQGIFTMEIGYHRPYWAIFEALAYNGREDFARMFTSGVYNRRFYWSLDGTVHRVGITGTPNGFTSRIIDAEFFLNLFIPNPIIAFNYGINGEYISQIKTKMGVNGPFQPVPYQTYENHSVRLYLYYTWRDRWYLTLYGGETYNRFGLHARTLGASLKYSKPYPCGWEIELSADRFPSTIIPGDTGEYFTGTIRGQF